jgi:HEAT repeat protein
MADALQIARELQAGQTDATDAAIVGALRADANAETILQELAQNPDLEVRGWVPSAARRILGSRAVPLLERMTRDSDVDIRGLALDALEDLDPRLLDPFVGQLHRALQSKDDAEVIAAAWKLVARGDQQAAEPIAVFRDRYEPWMWQHKAAEVMLLALASPEEIPRRIREHDHEHMTWLANAAIVVATPEGFSALRACSESSFDESCRNVCTHALTLGT